MSDSPNEGWRGPDDTAPPVQPPFGAAPYGYPAPGSYPFGSVPGVGWVPTPPKKSRRGIVFLVVVGVLVFAVAAAFYFRYRASGNDGGFFNPGVTDAKVGDCMPAAVEDNTNDISQTKTVDCTSADAKYTVVGVVDNRDEPSSDSTVFETDCQPYNATVGLWVGPTNGKGGKIYCLVDK